MFEVRHGLLCSAGRIEYIGQIVVQCSLAVTVPLCSTQGKGRFSDVGKQQLHEQFGIRVNEL